jgi:hypothetical protein
MVTDSVAKPKKFWPASDTGLMVKVVEAKEPAIRTRSIFKAALWAGGVGISPRNTSNIHRWYATGKGLARFAVEP